MLNFFFFFVSTISEVEVLNITLINIKISIFSVIKKARVRVCKRLLM